MKLWLIAFAYLLFPVIGFAGETDPSPVGHWFYVMKIYRGHEMPEPPEASLRLHYEFRADGSSRLYWWHEGEADLCEREGRYRIEDGFIVEQALKVNPRNHPSCSRDPDMQEGRITRTRYELINGRLHLHLPLADEFLIYVWKKIGP